MPPSLPTPPTRPRRSLLREPVSRARWAAGVLGLLALLAMAHTAVAADPEVWVFFRPDIPLYAETLRHLADLPDRTIISCPVGKTSASFVESHPPDLVITLGDAGLDRALDMPWQSPIVAVFATHPPTDRRVCFLEAPQPHSLQLKVLTSLAPACKTLWYPFAGDRFAPGPALRQAAARAGLDIIAHRLDDPRALPGALQHLASPRTAALLPPDPEIMNTAFVQAVLLAAFRSRSPVIGFSETLVKQGAVFAYVLSPEQLAATLADIIDHHPGQGPCPVASHFFTRWNLVVNATVIGKLGLALPEDVRSAATRLH
ncbi:MAG: hypothetical protein GX442_01735 [Candidatus Riflebacteria bacterium]|nr:hypothetical protein [Candidatus Riflebacteria bacterium]